MKDSKLKDRRLLRVFVIVGLVMAVPAAAVLIVSRDSSVREAGSTTSATASDAATSTSATASGELGFPTPDSADASADREYLEAEGRVLLVMHERATAVAGAQLTSDHCQQEAQSLDVDAPSDEVVARIGGLADEVLRDAFHAERIALGVVLTSCISDEASDDRAPGLAQSVEAVEVRLNEIGE